MIVYVLEWGMIGNKNALHIEAVCATYDIASRQASAGREYDKPEIKFTEDKSFFNRKRWSWKSPDGEMYRIREFEVDVE